MNSSAKDATNSTQLHSTGTQPNATRRNNALYTMLSPAPFIESPLLLVRAGSGINGDLLVLESSLSKRNFCVAVTGSPTTTAEGVRVAALLKDLGWDASLSSHISL